MAVTIYEDFMKRRAEEQEKNAIISRRLDEMRAARQNAPVPQAPPRPAEPSPQETYSALYDMLQKVKEDPQYSTEGYDFVPPGTMGIGISGKDVDPKTATGRAKRRARIKSDPGYQAYLAAARQFKDLPPGGDAPSPGPLYIGPSVGPAPAGKLPKRPKREAELARRKQAVKARGMNVSVSYLDAKDKPAGERTLQDEFTIAAHDRGNPAALAMMQSDPRVLKYSLAASLLGNQSLTPEMMESAFNRLGFNGGAPSPPPPPPMPRELPHPMGVESLTRSIQKGRVKYKSRKRAEEDAEIKTERDHFTSAVSGDDASLEWLRKNNYDLYTSAKVQRGLLGAPIK